MSTLSISIDRSEVEIEILSIEKENGKNPLVFDTFTVTPSPDIAFIRKF
jgi:hypothetical protein